MDRQTLLAISSLVLAGFLAGIGVYQQVEIVSLNARNDDLSLSVLQKAQEIDNLQQDNYRLNSTYFQLSASLQTVTALLNLSDSDFSSLQEEFSNLLESYNNLSDSYDILSAKIDALRNSIAELSQELGGYEGIFILNYAFVYTYVYPYDRYYAEIELYNALELANVTIKLYGTEGASKTFTYSMSEYSKRTFVETWTGQEPPHDYSLIIVDNVVRQSDS